MAGIAAGVSATAGSAESETQTLSFTSTVRKEVALDAKTFVVHAVDKQGGKVIGYDVETQKLDPQSGDIRIYVTISLRGGQILARLDVRNPGDDATGRILGGSGKYDGISGTIVGEQPEGNSSQVTLTYQL